MTLKAPPNPNGTGKKVASSKAIVDTSLSKIMAYESGQMPDDEVIEFFQGLVDNGAAWTLAGHYGRTAAALIEQGLVIRSQSRRQSPQSSQPHQCLHGQNGNSGE
jgi:hypothetical protein